MIYNIIIWYAILGVLTNFLYDLMISKLIKLSSEFKEDRLRFTILERIWITLIWPIFTVIFIIRAIKLYNDKY